MYLFLEEGMLIVMSFFCKRGCYVLVFVRGDVMSLFL